MYRTILLCYNGSHEGRAVLSEGAEMARRFGAVVHLLAVVRPSAGEVVAEAVAAEGAFAEGRRATREILREGIASLSALGLTAEGHIAVGDPVEEIAAAARRLGADLIVLGHRRRGPLSRWWRNPVDVSLLEQVPCSLLVAVAPETDEASP